MEDGFVLIPSFRSETKYAEQSHLTAIDRFIRDLEPSLWPLNSFIHDNPELAFEEQKAHNALTNFMRSREKWHVTKSAFGMETAWMAVYDSGKRGPVISFNAEMDALPELGHACGHNLIAMASVAAGLATAQMLHIHGLPGKVLIIGTPGEEGSGGGKIRCLESGAYKDVDATMISHPGILNNSPLVRTTAFVHLEVAYHGRPSHAANNPWLGINALDALIIAYNAISVLRQQTRPDDVIGLQITNGGTRPNIIHEYAAGVAVLRAASSSQLKQLQQKVEACFRAGAEATGAKLDIKVMPGYQDHIPNRVLASVLSKYWEELPGPMPDPPLPPQGQYTWIKASTDQGNLSYALPSINVSFAIPPGEARGQPHSRDFEKASGSAGAFNRAMTVAKAMAATATDLYRVPGLLAKVKDQWRRDMVDNSQL